MVHVNLLSMDPMLKRQVNSFEHSKGIPLMIIPVWWLELVLAAFIKVPFEPIVTCSLKHLPWKTTFLLAITSAHMVIEMHALSCKAPYIRFSNSGVTLLTTLIFLPKLTTNENAFHPISVPAMHNQKDRALDRLCVKHALNKYL